MSVYFPLAASQGEFTYDMIALCTHGGHNIIWTLLFVGTVLSRPSIIRTTNHSICGVHQIELISPLIENVLLHLSEYSVIRMARIDLVTKGVQITEGLLYLFQ